MNGSNGVFEKNDYVTWKRLDAGRSVMLDLNSGHYYTLDEVATEVWNLVSTRVSIDQVVSRLAGMFKVDAATAKQDVDEMVVFLTAKGFLRKSANPANGAEAGGAGTETFLRTYAKPVITEHEAVQEIAAAGTGGYSGGSHYWFPN